MLRLNQALTLLTLLAQQGYVFGDMRKLDMCSLKIFLAQSLVNAHGYILSVCPLKHVCHVYLTTCLRGGCVFNAKDGTCLFDLA